MTDLKVNYNESSALLFYNVNLSRIIALPFLMLYISVSKIYESSNNKKISSH